MEVDLHKYTELSTQYSNVIPYVLIAIGGTIFLIGSFACCCTLKGHPVLLYIYSGILTIVFILELGCCVSIYIYRMKLMEGFDEGITNAMNNYHNKNSHIASDFDYIQHTLHCCGNHNASDWLNVNPPIIPESCCIEENCNTDDETQIFEKGCYERVEIFLNANIRSIAIIATIVALFPLMGLILSYCLARLLNKHKYEQMA